QQRAREERGDRRPEPRNQAGSEADLRVGQDVGEELDVPGEGELLGEVLGDHGRIVALLLGLELAQAGREEDHPQADAEQERRQAPREGPGLATQGDDGHLGIHGTLILSGWRAGCGRPGQASGMSRILSMIGPIISAGTNRASSSAPPKRATCLIRVLEMCEYSPSAMRKTVSIAGSRVLLIRVMLNSYSMSDSVRT